MALTVVPPDFDGLQVLYIPVIAVPTVIFVVAALEPLLSMGSDARRSFRNRREFEKTRARQVISTLLRIGTPSVLAALLGFLYFDNLSLYLSSTLDNDTLRILANDNANGQFVQNFLISAGTLFAILAGNAYSDLYEQQERIFVSLYDEVTVAKLLLEQLTLVGQARPWYAASLRCMRAYVSELRNIQVAPIERLELKALSDTPNPNPNPNPNSNPKPNPNPNPGPGPNPDPNRHLRPAGRGPARGHHAAHLGRRALRPVRDRARLAARARRAARRAAAQVPRAGHPAALLPRGARAALLPPPRRRHRPPLGATRAEHGEHPRAAVGALRLALRMRRARAAHHPGAKPASQPAATQEAEGFPAPRLCLHTCSLTHSRTLQELWQPTGGVFNVDDVVQDMSFGLGEELRLRTKAMNNANAVFSRDFIEGGTGG